MYVRNILHTTIRKSLQFYNKLRTNRKLHGSNYLLCKNIATEMIEI